MIVLLVERDPAGVWYEVPEVSGTDVRVPLPGAHDATVAEFLGADVRTVRHYGEWIEVSGDAAARDPTVQRWCRRYANSELGNGAFRFRPSVWGERSGDPLELPYIPEFDHPDPAIRRLAVAETEHRRAVLRLAVAERERRAAVQAASAQGHSRRSLAALVGLSFARIQQLVSSSRD
jgi:hypothetical protein